MGRPVVWTYEVCELCQLDFKAKPGDHRTYCSAACSRLSRQRYNPGLAKAGDQSGSKNPMWKGDNASRWAMYKRAQGIKPDGPCERCGGPGEVVHHQDENPWNNAPENLERLCRPCHINHHRLTFQPSARA